MSAELLARLRVHIDQDEQVAKAAGGRGEECRWSTYWQSCEGWTITDGTRTVIAESVESNNAAHTARHDPARALRAVAWKRQVCDQYEAALAAVGEANRWFLNRPDDTDAVGMMRLVGDCDVANARVGELRPVVEGMLGEYEG